MKILVIGSGGREHALAKKFMESPQVEEGEVIVAKKLNPFVEKLAEKLEEQYPVVVVKNNQITVEDDNKVHTSVKITKKKSRLF